MFRCTAFASVGLVTVRGDCAIISVSRVEVDVGRAAALRARRETKPRDAAMTLICRAPGSNVGVSALETTDEGVVGESELVLTRAKGGPGLGWSDAMERQLSMRKSGSLLPVSTPAGGFAPARLRR